MDDVKSDDDLIEKKLTDEDRNSVSAETDSTNNDVAKTDGKSIDTDKVETKNSEAVLTDKERTVAAGIGNCAESSVPVSDTPTELTGDSPQHSDSSAAQKDCSAAEKKKRDKVTILFKATGGAPIMKKSKWIVEEEKSLGAMISFIRRYLKCEQQQTIFVYVNQSFAPSPDVAVGVLFECFGADGKLVLHYCMTQAWG